MPDAKPRIVGFLGWSRSAGIHTAAAAAAAIRVSVNASAATGASHCHFQNAVGCEDQNLVPISYARAMAALAKPTPVSAGPTASEAKLG